MQGEKKGQGPPHSILETKRRTTARVRDGRAGFLLKFYLSNFIIVNVLLYFSLLYQETGQNSVCTKKKENYVLQNSQFSQDPKRHKGRSKPQRTPLEKASLYRLVVILPSL